MRHQREITEPLKEFERAVILKLLSSIHEDSYVEEERNNTFALVKMVVPSIVPG